MFCNQCEQVAKGIGCSKIGVCGKTPETSNIQDLLVYTLQGLSQVALTAKKLGIKSHEADQLIVKGLFDTVTNVSFDPDRLAAQIKKVIKLREQLKAQCREKKASVKFDDLLTNFTTNDPIKTSKESALKYNVLDKNEKDLDIQSLKNLLLYGLKGMAAYADHAQILGQSDETVYDFFHQALVACTEYHRSLKEWIDLVLKCGMMNLRTMELLDTANTTTYGHPVQTEVPLGVKKGKAILVSGHDLKDLALLLEQTKNMGINVYTHSEMLQCHGYPALKKHPHFYGHFGTAWQNQQIEFAAFPGAILMTTNCIQNPMAYQDNIFTSGEVAWPGVQHIDNQDFTPVIEKALSLPGFRETLGHQTVVTGFGHNAVLAAADKIIAGVKSKKIRHFFLVGGCDGAKPGRNYYTKLVEQIPEDCLVLTLACGKFRFFDKKLGHIDGIPRLLDIGQCNDAYSAIQIALALANAFGCGVNDLPLSLVLSWYEQKAVVILLTLLALGIKNIRLGPSLPAFISPNVLNVLIENYQIKTITTPEADLKEILG